VRKRNYLLRLLVFSLILGAVPTFVIGFISYYIATEDVEEKVNEGNMQLLLQTEMRVEQMLKSLEGSVTQFVNSSLAREVLNETLTSRDFIKARSLLTELANLRTTAVIKDTYFVQFENDWALNFSNLRKLSEMENKDEFYAYARQAKGILWNTRTQFTPENPGNSESVYEMPAASAETISLVYKIPLMSHTKMPKGLLVISVAADDFRSVLTRSTKLGSSYILNSSGRMFLSSAPAIDDYGDINRMIAQRIQPGAPRDGFFYAGAGGNKVGVTYRSSSYNDWTYVSVASIAAVTKETRTIGLLTLGTCAGILLVVIILAYYGSRRMYLPIRNLLLLTKEVDHDGTHPGGRKDELELIKDGIQSLAVSNNKLKQLMQGQAGHLKEFFVLKLFTGQLSERELLQRSDMYGFPKHWNNLCVMALQIDGLAETRYQEQDRELLLFAVNNIVEELLPPETRFSPILLSDSQVTLLASSIDDPSELRLYCYRAAEMIKGKVEEYLQLQVSVGISCPFVRLTDTVMAYGQSLEALRCRISLGPGIITHFKDLQQNESAKTAVYSHLRPMEEQLMQALREIQPDKAMAVLDQYLAAVLHKDSFVKEHRILLLQLMTRILHVVQDQGVPLHKVLEGEGAVDRFLRLQTREEIRLWFQSRLFAPIVRMLAEKEERQFVSIADQLVCIIHERYDQELVLELIAAELNFHPVYLSRVFKKEVGIPFSDYVSEYRMKMAKRMLETTTMKISEIGEKLQYKNISAFIRTFRKTYDTTPGHYRERLDQAE
jgi:AraC-like DNA-binding protein